MGVADAGVNFGELTKSEIQKIRTAAAEGAREAAQHATKQVLEDRKEAERERLRRRLEELG